MKETFLPRALKVTLFFTVVFAKKLTFSLLCLGTVSPYINSLSVLRCLWRVLYQITVGFTVLPKLEYQILSQLWLLTSREWQTQL